MAYNRVMSRSAESKKSTVVEALKVLSGVSLNDAIPRKHEGEGVLGIVEDLGKSTYAIGTALFAPSVAGATESLYRDGDSEAVRMGLIAAACIDIALLQTRAVLAWAAVTSLAVLPSPLVVLPLCALAGLTVIERTAGLVVAHNFRRGLPPSNRI